MFQLDLGHTLIAQSRSICTNPCSMNRFELKGAENDQTRFKKEKVPEIAPNELSPASERVARRL